MAAFSNYTREFILDNFIGLFMCFSSDPVQSVWSVS